MHLRTIVAAVVGGIVLFLTGFLIYGLILASFVKANTVEYAGLMKDPPNMVALSLHNLVYGWFIAFVFDQWAGIRNFAGGFVGGGLIMFSVGLATVLGYLAFMDIYKGLTLPAVDVIAITIMGAITGGVIGAILGKMSGETAVTE